MTLAGSERKQYLGGLYYAVQTGNVNLARQFLKTGIDVTLRLSPNRTTESLMYFAMIRDDPKMMRLLQKSESDYYGVTIATRKHSLLKDAVRHKARNIVLELLKLDCWDLPKYRVDAAGKDDQKCLVDGRTEDGQSIDGMLTDGLSTDGELPMNAEPQKLVDILESRFESPPNLGDLMDFPELYGCEKYEMARRILRWRGRTLAENGGQFIDQRLTELMICEACSEDWTDVLDEYIKNRDVFEDAMNGFIVGLSITLGYAARGCARMLLPIVGPGSYLDYLYILCLFDCVDDLKMATLNAADYAILLRESTNFGSVNAVKYLLSLDIPSNVKLEDLLAETLKAKSPSADLVRFLVERGVDVAREMENHFLIKDVKQKFVSPLTLACRNGNVEIVRLLLDAGATEDGGAEYTAFHAACDADSVEIWRLLSSKFSTDASDVVEYLLYACLKARPEMTRVLLKLADVNSFDPATGDTPLIRISKTDSKSTDDASTVFEMLIAAGALVTGCNHDGISALIAACRARNLKLVDRLLELGAEVHRRNVVHVFSFDVDYDDKSDVVVIGYDDEYLMDFNRELLSSVRTIVTRLRHLQARFLIDAITIAVLRIADDKQKVERFFPTFMYLLKLHPESVASGLLSKGMWKIETVAALDAKNQLTSAQLCEILDVVFDYCSYAEKCSFFQSFERHLFQWRSHNPFILSYIVRKLCGIPYRFSGNTLAFQGVLHDGAFVRLLLDCGCHAADVKSVFKYWFGANVFESRPRVRLPSERLAYIERVRRIVSKPGNLQVLCRVKVRNVIFQSSTNVADVISNLPIPSHMKDYIAML
ncbi:uncharacterized protein LOC141912778 [Tubulanus polymorphus]|uniref:uncharacterized protein LOC141912778 n=1 Tax=Tubulanus polymorphus TaxID=672921 RepID=UPI003DA2A345